MIYEELYNRIREKYAERKKEILVVGIYGMPGSGKTYFNTEFTIFLQNKGITTLHLEGDIYTNTSREDRNKVIEKVKELKKKGKVDSSWIGEAYSYDLDLMMRHVKKIKEKKDFLSKGLCDPNTKRLDLKFGMNFSEEGIRVINNHQSKSYKGEKIWILIDWAFLGAKKIIEKLDVSVFLEASFDERLRRVKEKFLNRPVPIKVDEDFFRDADIHQKNQFGIFKERADIVIDNNDYKNPRIEKGLN
jgi:uridine kinase